MSGETTEDPLRILMTADAVGGVWRYSLDLIGGLIQGGAKVLLATMGPRPSEEQKRQIAAIPNVALVESDFALEWMPNPWADVDAAGKWLLEIAEQFEPHVIHLSGYAHASLPWRRHVLVVAHSCVFSWWRAVHGSAPGAEWDEYRSRVSSGLSAADVIVAPSQSMARSVMNEYDVSPEKLRVIHNFSSIEALQRVQKQPFFLAAGRVWDPAKNIASLEKIAPKLNWPMHIAGSDRGPGDSATEMKSVHFLGMLPYSELLKEMSRASVFVHPALYEPFGLAVLEAARHRCCLVLADIPSLREFWNGAAIFVNPRNPAAWITELNSISMDSEKRARLGELACYRAAEYNADSTVTAYRQLYKSLLERPQPVSSEVAA